MPDPVRRPGGEGALMRPWLCLAAGASLLALSTAWAATRLPGGAVPLQFGRNGQVNRWGTRADVLAPPLLLGAVLLVLGIVLVLLAWYGPARSLNVPHRGYWLTPEREPVVRRMLAEDAALVVGVVLAFLALLPVWAVLGTEGGSDALPPVLILGPVAVLVLGVPAWGAWLVLRRYRPPPPRE